MIMRQYIRHPFAVPIKYKMDDTGRIHEDDMRNISEGGLSFQAQTPIEKGAEIIINIAVKSPAFEAHGIVMWCKEELDHFEVGVQFDSPTAEFGMRMVEQVCYIEQYRRDVKEFEGRELSPEAAAREWIEKYAKELPS